MWASPPAVVTALRAQILACAVVQSAGIAEPAVHYPTFDPSYNETDPTFPAVLIAETDHRRRRYAEGALPLVGGVLVATFYLPLVTHATSGAVETFARTVVEQLGRQYYGIAWESLECSLASDPTPGARAAADGEEDPTRNTYRTITLTINYGLTR